MSSVASIPAVLPIGGFFRTPWIRVVRTPAAQGWSAVLLLLGLCGVLFFYGLAGEFYRTESLRAIVAADFLRSGNWIVPTLYGEPMLTKPPGMYAAIALASWPLGHVTEWTARLPSALAATVTVFLFYWYFGRQLGRLGGLVAGLLLPVSFMWLDKAPAAEIDMLQVAWVTASIFCFLRRLRKPRIEDRGLRIENRETRFSIFDLRSSILHPRAGFGGWRLFSVSRAAF